MDVRHEPDRQRFVADVDGGIAVLDYARIDAATLEYNHTFVPPAARGRGVASALAERALRYALENGYAVIPSCPFIAVHIRRNPQYAKLVKR